MERLARECGGDLKGAAIHRGSRRCGDQSADVTGVASDLIEELGAFLGLGRLGQRRVARRRLRCPDETSKVVNIFKTVRPGLIVRLRDGIAERRDLGGKQFVGDPHLGRSQCRRSRAHQASELPQRSHVTM